MELLDHKRKNSVSKFIPTTHDRTVLIKEKNNNQSISEIEKAFMPFGFTQNEVKVFLHLALTGTQKARQISSALSIHRTETYKILRDLEKRGILSITLEKPLKFTAIPFSEAYDILVKTEKLNLMKLERKKQNFVDLWQSIPQRKRDLEVKEVFQILEGKETIIMKINEI